MSLGAEVSSFDASGLPLAASTSLPGSQWFGSPPTASLEKTHRVTKQLSPSVLVVLLEDLMEYNGISFRRVPPRTFREKYIGLYFGVASSERCRRFLQHLKAFYVIVNHKFECVLVDCSTSEEEYKQHVQMTLWPTYPQGDYRALLLRKHFEIGDVPQLVILDPNGMVVTCNGVARVEADNMALSFPWCERVVDNLWGHRAQGQLKVILENLELPSVNGVDAVDLEVVGMLFGEPWCPETRELITRLQYMQESRRERRLLQWQADNGDFDNQSDLEEEVVGFYFIHTEGLEKYRAFPDFHMPFPTLQVEDEEMLEALRHYMGVNADVPALVIVAPEEGWVLRDGAGWLMRDTTGILFPWKQQITPADLLMGEDDEEGFADIPNLIQPIDEDSLNTAICQGPVFVAFLNKVGARRAHALKTIRSAVVTFLSQPAQPQSQHLQEASLLRRRGSLDTESVHFADRHYSHGEAVSEDTASDDVSSGKRDALTRQLQTHAHRRYKKGKTQSGGGPPPFGEDVVIEEQAPEKPGWESIGRSSRIVVEPERVLWRCTKAAGDHDSMAGGSAPWNAKDVTARPQSGMAFFYSVANDRASHLLGKFCCHDAKSLRQHHIWKESHHISGVDIDCGLQEMRERLVEFSPAASRGSTDGGSMSRSSTGRFGVTDGANGFEFEWDKDKEDQFKQDSVQAKIDPVSKEQEFQPRTRFAAWREITEELLGDGKSGQGSAMILDMARGCYYVCGNIVDQDNILRFLDGWQQGALDAFEIGVLNPDELVRDEEQEVARQLAAGTHPKFLPTELDVLAMPNPMPGIVIWVPTKQHALSGESIPDMFKSLLSYGVRRCPTEDNSTFWRHHGTAFDSEDLQGPIFGGGYNEKLSPRIDKFWIFALTDCDEASSEEGHGKWEPPPGEWLAQLNQYVKACTKKQFAEELRDIRSKADRDRSVSALGSWGDGQSSSPMMADEGLSEGDLSAPPFPSDALWGSADGAATPSKEKLSTSRDASTGRDRVFDEPLRQLRLRDSQEPFSITGNYSITLRTARTRRELYKMMLEEIGYHANMQCPPPPLFMLYAGDLPPHGSVPWPSSMKMASMQVVGGVPNPLEQREISPMMQVVDWERWLRNSMDPNISPTMSKHIQVPWI